MTKIQAFTDNIFQIFKIVDKSQRTFICAHILN